VRHCVDVKLLIFTIFEPPSYLGFNCGNGAKSVDGEGDFRAIHRDGHVFGSDYTKLDEFGELEIAEYGCSDGYCGWVGDGGGRGYEHDPGGFRNGGRVGDTHGDFLDIGIDCRDSFESFDCERDDCAVYCDGNFLGQFDAEPDELSDMDFADHERSHDHSGRIGDGVGARDHQDSSYVGKCERLGDIDGDFSDFGFDCGDGAQPFDSEGDFRTIYGDRDVFG
jgi:hypothetical protein